MSLATYLYCVIKADKKPVTTGVPDGVPGSRAAIDLVATGPSLWLAAGSVPLDTYGPGHLDRLLGDMEAVGRIAVAHEAVVEHFTQARGATVIPMKLFTMFSSIERAVADISSRRKGIEAAMKRIAGCEEWGVRVLRGERSTSAKPASAPTSGAAFLAAKKEARDHAKSALMAAATAAVGAFERLSPLARESRRRDDAPAAGAAPPLLDAAFLVTIDRREAFTDAARSEAEACERAGAQLTLSGPWPAYNFVNQEATQ